VAPSRSVEVENRAKLGFSSLRRYNIDEIWQVSVDLGSTLSCQIWPFSVKGWTQESLNNREIGQNCGFGPLKVLKSQYLPISVLGEFGGVII